MCDSCEVLNIQGHNCHETNCPEAWKEETRACVWCGERFEPEQRHENCCSWDCVKAYNGIECPERE